MGHETQIYIPILCFALTQIARFLPIDRIRRDDKFAIKLSRSSEKDIASCRAFTRYLFSCNRGLPDHRYLRRAWYVWKSDRCLQMARSNRIRSIFSPLTSGGDHTLVGTV